MLVSCILAAFALTLPGHDGSLPDSVLVFKNVRGTLVAEKIKLRLVGNKLVSAGSSRKTLPLPAGSSGYFHGAWRSFHSEHVALWSAPPNPELIVYDMKRSRIVHAEQGAWPANPCFGKKNRILAFVSIIDRGRRYEGHILSLDTGKKISIGRAFSLCFEDPQTGALALVGEPTSHKWANLLWFDPVRASPIRESAVGKHARLAVSYLSKFGTTPEYVEFIEDLGTHLFVLGETGVDSVDRQLVLRSGFATLLPPSEFWPHNDPNSKEARFVRLRAFYHFSGEGAWLRVIGPYRPLKKVEGKPPRPSYIAFEGAGHALVNLPGGNLYVWDTSMFGGVKAYGLPPRLGNAYIFLWDEDDALFSTPSQR